ncbi:abc-type antimicrobial peptide transport system, permease component [hydrocarbon metagenome]|uniref:Abc-type antimicrobial peptide transport system, permease component n=1 Tax=hydrocarbon metagenome TaxID=938273 RepID=A0A0W8G4I3_9ZZZZ
MANKHSRLAAYLAHRSRRGTTWLRMRDIMRVSIREVLRKRRRYIGVIAAIALGTAGFITIVTMGRDLKTNFNNDLDMLGGATIINPYFEQDGAERLEWFRDRTLTSLARIPGVMEVSSVLTKPRAITTFQDRIFGFNLVGVDAAYWRVFSFNAAAGRLFDDTDVAEGARVCVVGTLLARTIFGGDQEALGQILSIDDNLYQVVGVLGGVRAGDRGQFIFLPYTTARARVVDISQPYSVYIRCATWDDVAPVAAAVKNVVEANQIAKGLRVNVAWEPLKQVQRIFWWVSLFIYSSIVATLILGGLGIWNIMMAAVVSRTREIGLKKAMGALDNDIFFQFLFESLCVTMTASLLGIGLGRVGVEYMSHMLGSRPPEGLFLVCLLSGLLFAVVIGVGAGMYPSIRASRMQVVEAMRYE